MKRDHGQHTAVIPRDQAEVDRERARREPCSARIVTSGGDGWSTGGYRVLPCPTADEQI